MIELIIKVTILQDIDARVAELQQDVDMRNAQINELQQQILRFSSFLHDNKVDNIHKSEAPKPYLLSFRVLIFRKKIKQ